MRAMAVTGYDQPLEPIERSAQRPGPGEVLLDIAYCGVCRTDLKVIRGQMPFSKDLPLPHVPGHEIVGRVREGGEGTSIRPGTGVVVYLYEPCGVCPRCQEGEENRCQHLRRWVGLTHEGGFQEQIVLRADRVIPVPDGLDLREATPIPCAIATAYRATVTRAGVQAGETVVVSGCGGVGLHALQIVRAAGATAIAVDPDSHARDMALSLGAAHALDPGEAAWAGVLRDLTTEGPDAVIDTSGVPEVIEAMACSVRPGGRIILVGYRLDAALSIPLTDAVLREVEVRGSRYATRGEMARAINLVAAELVRPVIREVLPLRKVNEAFRILEEGSPAGRIVLEVGNPG